MIRTFQTHEVRKSHELSGRLWEFAPVEEGKAGDSRMTTVPGCWENIPGFADRVTATASPSRISWLW